MKNLYVFKNDNRVIRIRLSESAEVTGLKILRMMKRQKQLTKQHWAGIIAIVASANEYTARDYANLRLICGIQSLKPLKEAKYWYVLLKYVNNNRFRIYNQDIAVKYTKRAEEKMNAIFSNL